MLVCASVPWTAFAVEEDTVPYTDSTTGYLESRYDSAVVKMESYLTNNDSVDVDVQPCDIIFVMDQSKWMNTEYDAGAERAAIINSSKKFLSMLAAPTNGEEHRVAIVGCGRLNLDGAIDPYDADIYPGQVSYDRNVSINTGYYTTKGFVSRNGWTEVKDVNSADLPKMPAGYLTGESYENVFMTLSEAESVLDTQGMMAWYSGASRMDAGLMIAEQLTTIANNYDKDNDRNLIVCIIASSLPIHNVPERRQNTIRNDAVLEASKQLKAAGATIFAFGDYHESGIIMDGATQDTLDNFNTVMKSVCSQPDYYYSLSDYANVTQALNRLISRITITAAGEAEHPYTVRENTFTVNNGVDIAIEGSTDDDGVKTITWKDAVDYLNVLKPGEADEIIKQTMAEVEFYNFIGYDSDGNPEFENEPFVRDEIPLENIARGDELAYSTVLIPLPTRNEKKVNVRHADAYATYGNKVVVTISLPVTITYAWASDESGYAPEDVEIPASEVMVLGTTHTAPLIRTKDAHYRFDGWYTDQACTQRYSGQTIQNEGFTLYGKWTQCASINYFWNFNHFWSDYEEQEYPDAVSRIEIGEIPETYIPDVVSGIQFDGWYEDKECKKPYVSEPLTKDIDLYAKWLLEDAEYNVKYYLKNQENDAYTEVTEDALTLTGMSREKPDMDLITKSYEGFELSRITYENSITEKPQETPLLVRADGSLLIKMYFDPKIYLSDKISYEEWEQEAETEADTTDEDEDEEDVIEDETQEATTEEATTQTHMEEVPTVQLTEAVPPADPVPATDPDPDNNNSPMTGDNSSQNFWIVLSLLSMLGFAGTALYKNRENY
jgi:hypothetical protein